jgi:hypothetical protein
MNPFDLPDVQFWLYTVILLLTAISMINGVTLFPLVFTRSIVPGIEKKIGQKLGYYRLIYKMSPYTKVLGQYVEVAFYILVKYLAHAFGKDPNKIRVGPRTFALQRVNYPFAMFTKKEIVWSFLAIINAMLFWSCGGLLILLDKYFQLS